MWAVLELKHNCQIVLPYPTMASATTLKMPAFSALINVNHTMRKKGKQKNYADLCILQTFAQMGS